ncbi:MAG TPA: hypothetical protein VHS31_12485 [Tepidisphaeraceae bacterium]|jgi:hypothetical protein|nr:hypothetical protein [Tepidisphaeraceae bacterium]
MTSNSTLVGALKKLMRQPSFLVAAGILLVSAISLNAATEYLQLYFKKVPVDLSADFSTIPPHLGHWVQVSKDERLGEDMEHELGATHYLYRDYMDDRLFSAKDLEEFNGKTFSERKALAARFQASKPQGIINVGITYYTGSVDTVAHVPDRCYIADGYEPTSHNYVSWSAFEGRPGRADIKDGDVCYINFEDQIASRQAAAKNVAYFFNANGEYTADPIGVRLRLQDLRQRYAYYSKIELLTVMRDADESATVMNDFLTSALPEVERCLPDWKKLTSSGQGK